MKKQHIFVLAMAILFVFSPWACEEVFGGLLYGMRNEAGIPATSDILYRINQDNGSYDVVSDNSAPGIGGLAYNSSDGYLYGMRNEAGIPAVSDILYRINPNNGSYNVVSDNSAPGIGGLAYNSSDGYLYGMRNEAGIPAVSDILYRISPNNGSYDVVSDSSALGVGGLAYVPEPATIILLGFGSLTLLRRKGSV